MFLEELSFYVCVDASSVRKPFNVITYCGLEYANEAMRKDMLSTEYTVTYPNTRVSAEDEYYIVGTKTIVSSGKEYSAKFEEIYDILVSSVNDIELSAESLPDTAYNAPSSTPAVEEMSYNENKPSVEEKNILDLKDFVLVNGGSFFMGATSEQKNYADESEYPAREVEVKTFLIGKYEVTQDLWCAVMGSNPSDHVGDKLPVENVSWLDVQEFISKLNQMTGNQFSFRLPTEAEWEYAARGGQSSSGRVYSGSDTLSEVGFYESNSDSQSHPVGILAPNELGIYDMSGNVWEWCQDTYGSYSEKTEDGIVKSYRGGSWLNEDTYCRVSMRGSAAQDLKSRTRGFRLALDFIPVDTPKKEVSSETKKDEPAKKKAVPSSSQKSSAKVQAPSFPSYRQVEVKPTFKGGDLSAFNAWVNQLASSYNSGKGSVTVSFVVDKFGKVNNVKVIKSTNASLNSNAKTLVSMSPNWVPGRNKGQIVPTLCTVTVVFK